MANKYTKTPAPKKQLLEELYFTRNMTQSEIGVEFGVTQRVVFRWFRDLDIKSRVSKKRNQSGINNDSWKGDKATYAAFHHRVEVKRGKPKKCEVCKTEDKSKSYDWANLTGAYQNINDYKRMCRSCHRKYDKNRPNSSLHVRRRA